MIGLFLAMIHSSVAASSLSPFFIASIFVVVDFHGFISGAATFAISISFLSGTYSHFSQVIPSPVFNFPIFLRSSISVGVKSLGLSISMACFTCLDIGASTFSAGNTFPDTGLRRIEDGLVTHASAAFSNEETPCFTFSANHLTGNLAF